MHAALNLPLAALALLALQPSASQGTNPVGKLTGKVSTSKVNTKGSTSEKDLVIYLEPKEKPKTKVTAKSYTVMQKQLNFEPHVLAVPTGSKVTYKNEDKIKHNVWCKDCGGEIDKDTTAAETTEKTYDQPGVMNVTCRLHPDMSMYLVVVDTDLFTTCSIEKGEANGEKTYSASYEIASIPPGEYTLKTWNKKLPGVERTVVIEAGKTLTLDLEIKK